MKPKIINELSEQFNDNPRSALVAQMIIGDDVDFGRGLVGDKSQTKNSYFHGVRWYLNAAMYMIFRKKTNW